MFGDDLMWDPAVTQGSRPAHHRCSTALKSHPGSRSHPTFTGFYCWIHFVTASTSWQAGQGNLTLAMRHTVTLDSWLILVNEEFPKSLLSNGSANPIHRQDFFILRKLKLPENKNFPLLIYRYCFDEGNHDIWIFGKWAVPVHYP